MCGVRGHFYRGDEQAPLGRGRIVAADRPWPRASAADLERAREALGPFEPARALQALERSRAEIAEGLGPLLEGRLGLAPESARRAAGWVAGPGPAGPLLAGRFGRSGSPGARAARREEGSERPAQAPPLVLACHWSDLADRPLERLASAFAAGRSVLWLGDEHLPEVPALVVGALARGGLDGGALALLHAPDPGLLKGVDGSPQRGPGVAWVGPGHDLEAAAAHCVSAAFGDLPALGGRRSGSLERVVADRRVFSAFTEALLAELEDFGAELLEPLDGEARRELEGAVERMLDLGATPILGADGGWRPAVLTNVELHVPTRTGAAGAGVPMLVLSRGSAPSDAVVAGD